MKIAHLTSAHHVSDTRIFRKMCCSIAADEKYDVELVVCGKETIEDSCGVKIKYASTRRRARVMRMLFSSYDVYRTAVKLNADIYHLHDPELLPYGILLELKGAKVVYDSHEDLPNQILSKHYIPKLLRRSLSYLVHRLEKYLAGKLSAVVGATEVITDKFPNKIKYTLRNYPLLSEFADCGVKHGAKKEGFIYVGGIAKVRGIVHIVKALEEAHDESVFLKLGGNYIPSTLVQELEIRPGWQRVRDLGWLSREEVSREIGSSLAGLVILMPTISYKESLPIKMFEYMAAGIPVLASDFELWRSIVTLDSCGLLVDPESPLEIAEAMKWIIANPSEALEMGKRGRVAVFEKYNWEAERLSMFDLYGELVN